MIHKYELRVRFLCQRVVAPFKDIEKATIFDHFNYITSRFRGTTNNQSTHCQPTDGQSSYSRDYYEYYEAYAANYRSTDGKPTYGPPTSGQPTYGQPIEIDRIKNEPRLG